MKTIICGPPHSGKSVFVSNIVHLMPSDSFQRIAANGDGEGVWSNNPNQTEVKGTRIKGSNDSKDFKQWRDQIDSASRDVVLVDIGGRLQDDKATLFEACDSFIIVSSDKEMIDRWRVFGESHGCRCLASIYTELEGTEKIIRTEDDFIEAKMAGLERGRNLAGSAVISAVAELIVRMSGYKGYVRHNAPDEIDLFYIGRKFGCGNLWHTKNGIEVCTEWYTHDKAGALYQYIIDTYSSEIKYKVYGAKSIWVTSVLTTALRDIHCDDFVFYDLRSNSYVKPQRLTIDEDYSNKNLTVELTETDSTVLMKLKCDGILDVATFNQTTLPEIDSSKALAVSGRLPLWFISSVLLSYNNSIKYVHEPGIGYILVENDDQTKLGSILSEKELIG